MNISEASGRQTEFVEEDGHALYPENAFTEWSPCGYQGRPSAYGGEIHRGSRIPLLNAPEHSAVHLFLPRAPGALIKFPFQACLVHTSQTIRLCYFMERLLQRRRPLMLVGTAGTGKSVLVGAKLASLDAEEYLVKNVPFNYYTTSTMLQGKAPRGVEGTV